MEEEKFFIGIKALILNQKNQLLILKSGPLELKPLQTNVNFWDLPGGRIKKGEQILKTLRREVFEELGVDKEKLEIMNIFDASISNLPISVQNKTPLMLITFRCNLQQQDNFKLSLEHSESKWVSVEDAKKLLSTKFNKAFIDKLNNLV